MKIHFHDLTCPGGILKQQYLSALESVIADGNYILGDAVFTFEQNLSQFGGLRDSIAVGSGTDALYLALTALKARSKSRQKKYVITTPMSYIASTSSIYLSGLQPIFCDVDKAMNLCPKQVEEILQGRDDILAILLVHLGGIPAQMASYCRLTLQYGVPVVEDCAQAFGTQYDDISVGTFGEFGAFSFHPLKIYSALGDAGAVAAANPIDIDFLRMARNHGHITRDNVQFFSHNMRMDAIQARFLDLKLSVVDESIMLREQQVRMYKDCMAPLIEDGILAFPSSPKKTTRISYNFFMIRAPNRARLQEFMTTKGIETKVHYERLLTDLDATKKMEAIQIGELPIAHVAVKEILSLPLGQHICHSAIEYICETITDFYRGT